MEPNNIQYPSAKVVLRSVVDNRVLLLSRTIEGISALEPAGGKVDADFQNRISESFEQCAIREIREELGLEIKITNYLGSYYFFWSSKNNACSHCVLFLADIVEGTVDSVQQEACGILAPVWVTLAEMKQKKIPVKEYHVGLADLLVKAAYTIEP